MISLQLFLESIFKFRLGGLDAKVAYIISSDILDISSVRSPK